MQQWLIAGQLTHADCEWIKRQFKQYHIVYSNDSTDSKNVAMFIAVVTTSSKQECMLQLRFSMLTRIDTTFV